MFGWHLNDCRYIDGFSYIAISLVDLLVVYRSKKIIMKEMAKQCAEKMAKQYAKNLLKIDR